MCRPVNFDGTRPRQFSQLHVSHLFNVSVHCANATSFRCARNIVRFYKLCEIFILFLFTQGYVGSVEEFSFCVVCLSSQVRQVINLKVEI